jgi:hypothetical protein
LAVRWVAEWQNSKIQRYVDWVDWDLCPDFIGTVGVVKLYPKTTSVIKVVSQDTANKYRQEDAW